MHIDANSYISIALVVVIIGGVWALGNRLGTMKSDLTDAVSNLSQKLGEWTVRTDERHMAWAGSEASIREELAALRAAAMTLEAGNRDGRAKLWEAVRLLERRQDKLAYGCDRCKIRKEPKDGSLEEDRRG